MNDFALAELRERERKLLEVFLRHGRDGRAITMESLVAIAGPALSWQQLTTASRDLVARGVVQRAGGDPIPGTPLAFRLSPDVMRRSTEAARDEPGQAKATLPH